MASVADKSYRLMCKEYGASYLVSEMISSKGLCFGDKKTARLCEIESEERPYALQLFGEDPYYMGKAAYKLNEYSPDIIDINMGCPVPKIVGNGSGSALMKLPDTAAEICREVVKNANCPVTVKFRAGWDENSINAVEFAKLMEQAGASAVTCHGRTRTQFYSGKADWDIIKQVKGAVKIPVIASGGAGKLSDFADAFLETDCSAALAASLFHFKELTVGQVKDDCRSKGIIVR